MAIQVRSPHFESVSNSSLSYGILKLYIWTGDKNTDVPTNPIYTIRKSAITPTSGNPIVTFEMSELIRDYLDVEFDGNYSGQGVWVKVDLDGKNSSDGQAGGTEYTTIAFDGYYYFEETLPTSSNIMITNRKLFVLEDNTFRIPINTSSSPTVTFLKDNEVVGTTSFTQSDESSEQIKYVSIYGDDTNWDSFKERVLEDTGNPVFESSKCLQSFFNEFSIGAVDKIIVSDSSGVKIINVETLQECKYEPKKVTFINKFGALQDMYFFKKSVESMNVEKESYKSNILNYDGTYSSSNHVYRDFNVVAKESITLSSGFLDEEYNKVFKEMMLSEKVWVTNITEDGEQVLPINVKTGEITYKTSLNDKLVQYTIQFDKSFDTINNIR